MTGYEPWYRSAKRKGYIQDFKYDTLNREGYDLSGIARRTKISKEDEAAFREKRGLLRKMIKAGLKSQ